MIDQLYLGHVRCDYLAEDDFLQQCEKWLESPNLHHVVTLNPEMVMLAEHNFAFRAATKRADIRVPDGAGLIWARWYIRSGFWSLLPSLLAFSFRTVQRITGVDAVMTLTSLCKKKSKHVYLLGGTQSQVMQTHSLLVKKFPGMSIKASRTHSYDLNGPKGVLKDIAQFRPAMLFVAYGAPKQTIWIEKHRKLLQKSGVRIAVGVGGAFAILGEETPRAPHILRRMNLEWLWRLILEPQRFPRIWSAVAKFPLLVHAQKKQEQQYK